MRHARVLLADDHTMVAQGLASLLQDDFDLVGTVGDGQGFDLATGRRHGGLGLISIDERVRLVQGSVHIVTEPRRGTELRVLVPLHAWKGTPLEEANAPRKSAVGR